MTNRMKFRAGSVGQFVTLLLLPDFKTSVMALTTIKHLPFKIES